MGSTCHWDISLIRPSYTIIFLEIESTNVIQSLQTINITNQSHILLKQCIVLILKGK